MTSLPTKGKPQQGVIPRAEVEQKVREANACINCGEDLRYTLKDGTPAKTGHFFPPCMGEAGFWICEKKETQP